MYLVSSRLPLKYLVFECNKILKYHQFVPDMPLALNQECGIAEERLKKKKKKGLYYPDVTPVFPAAAHMLKPWRNTSQIGFHQPSGQMDSEQLVTYCLGYKQRNGKSIQNCPECRYWHIAKEKVRTDKYNLNT